MISKKAIYLFITFLTFSSVVNSQIVIRDSVFTTTLDIVGASWDNAIIKNCTFKNTILSDGLRIANANFVTIDSCQFYNIQGNGIRLHSSGTSDGVIIKNCSFDSIYGNGILSAEQHTNTQIVNNKFNWIGLDTESELRGAPHHGIYFIGNDFLISGNRICNIYNNNGNCVSVRSNGIVRNNVLSDATKNGISYFSDHPNVGNSLLIENNIVYNCQRGVSVANGGKSYVDSTIIRFNTLITNNYMSVSIGSGLAMINEIYGNVLIRKDGSTIYIWAESQFDSTKNVLSNTDVGFVDFLKHDYHITSTSIAYRFATGLTDYPSHDFENDIRELLRLDAGADQLVAATAIQNIDLPDIIIYPNPTNTEINIVLPQSENTRIEISNMLGIVLIIRNNEDKIDISGLTKGIYFIWVRQGQRTFLKKLIKE
ncbi:MAG TPA: hypothetical protein DCQ31_15130 [Bacteroidales bacterium]|nr:hypothetical protein [Bacteroidales bacterium]